MRKGRQTQGTLKRFMRFSITLIGKPDKDTKLMNDYMLLLLMNVDIKTPKQNVN